MRKLRRFAVVACAGLASVIFSAAAAAQDPPADEPDVEVIVAREVNQFYQDYWKAWERNDFNGISARLAADFVQVSFTSGEGAVQIGRETAVESVRQFVDAVRGREALWSFRLLSLLARSEREAVVVVRSDLTWLGGEGQDELSLEILRKDSDGQWRIARRTAARRTR